MPGVAKIGNMSIIAMLALLYGCTTHVERNLELGGGISEAKCMRVIGEYYFFNSVKFEDVFRQCQIEPYDKRSYFSNFVKKGKLDSDELSPENKMMCWDSWSSRISRAELAAQDRILSNKEKYNKINNFDLIQSAMFEGFLTGEAFEEYTAAGNSESSSFQCITPYNAVNIARELNLTRLWDGNISIPSLSKPELQAVWLTVLHADMHLDVQEKFASLFTDLAEDGLFDGMKVAILADRISNVKKQPLKYGVLYVCVDGQISHEPDEDELAQINENRKLIKMESYEIWMEKKLVEGVCD